MAWAIVDLGYAASAFAFAWDDERGMVVDHSMMGIPRVCRVRQSSAARFDARFVQRRDFGVVSAHFVQPVGTFTGVIHARGRTFELVRVPGVVEDQDVVW